MNKENAHLVHYHLEPVFLLFLQDLTVTVSSDHGEHEVEFIEDDKEICGLNLQSFVDEQEWQLHSTVETWTKVRES